jgi:hypothetical protein
MTFLEDSSLLNTLDSGEYSIANYISSGESAFDDEYRVLTWVNKYQDLFNTDEWFYIMEMIRSIWM